MNGPQMAFEGFPPLPRAAIFVPGRDSTRSISPWHSIHPLHSLDVFEDSSTVWLLSVHH